MTPRRLTDIFGGLLAIALAVAARPALASAPQGAFVHAAAVHTASVPTAPVSLHAGAAHTLPASMVEVSHHKHARHHHHASHHSNLTRDLSASAPASLPMHPAGLPHSSRAATAHHAPTVVVRQGKGSSRAASFLAERFAWRVDRLAFAVSSDERGIPKNNTFDVNAGRGPPRAGPIGDSSAPSASHAAPASNFDHPDNPARTTNDLPLARRVFGVPPSAAASAFREPCLGAASLGERCRTTRSRVPPAPAIAAPEARRVA